MKYYELMYIVKPLGDEVFQGEVRKIDDLINNNGGKVSKTDIWGKKRLAYIINDNTEGIYVLVTFEAKPACIKEADRVLRISENILRHMFISKN